MKNLVLIGPPGSGKGTQSNILKERFGYIHVSTGDLLRAEVAKGNELGNRIKDVMASGALVSDDLVAELLKVNVDLSQNKYIFDGFPRNVEQAKILADQILKDHKYIAVLFEMDLDGLVKRITNRRVSEDGKHIYNLLTNAPKSDGVCDITGQKLIQRKDDKEEVVLKRMKVYKSETYPMVDFYRGESLLKTVDAEQAIGDVTEQLINIIEEE